MADEVKEPASMLDAINSAVAPPELKAAVVEPPEPDEVDDDADETVGADADGDATAGEGDVSAGADAKAGTAKPEGDGKKAVAGDAVEQTEEEKAAADAAEAAKKAAKPSDPLNDPIPPTVSERTRERITSLVGLVKERDEVIAKSDELLESIASTGMSGDEFATMLTYSRLMRSTKPEDQERAFQFLAGEYRAFAIRLGKTDAVDLLADYPDLKEELEAGTLTEKRANEIALSRTRTADAERTRTASANTTEAETAHVNAVNAAKVELGKLEAVLRKDPHYDAKYAHLVPIMKEVFPGVHPSHWAGMFRKAWEKLPANFAAAAAPVVPPRTPAPLRPNKQPSGQGVKQAATMQEAMEAGLAAMKS